MHLLLHSRSQLPDQPHHREQLDVRECFDQSAFRIKAPKETKSGQRNEQRHYDVANRWLPDFSALQDCERPQPERNHSDQPHAGAKSRNRDGVFPRHGEHQQPQRAERNFSKCGKLFGACKQAGKSAGK